MTDQLPGRMASTALNDRRKCPENVPDEKQFTTRLIHLATQRLVGVTGITRDDIPDLQQDIWLDLLERLPNYHPERGHYRAFVSRVIKNKVASILTSRSAAKRGNGLKFLSLSDEFEDEDGDPFERHETISVDDYLRRTRGTVRPEEERRDLSFDMRRMADRQPPHCLAVCLLLIDRDVCDVANVVGLPRSTLRDLIKRLRVIGERAGLRDYFK